MYRRVRDEAAVTARGRDLIARYYEDRVSSAALQALDAFEEARLRLIDSMPREAADWEALETFWRPAIAVYSVDCRARQEARPLRSLALPLMGAL